MAKLTNYAGNQACSACHPEEFKNHAGSEHAHALSRVDAKSHGALFRKPSDITDPKRGMHYRTSVVGDRCVLTATSGTGQWTAEATFGFGSGKNGITYLGKQEHLEPELRLSYYPQAGRWTFSPGQAPKSQSGGLLVETGLVKPAETVEGCFICHSTVIAKEQNRLLPETVMMGVGCEACHGPGKEHIAAARRGDRDLRMVKLGAVPGPQLTIELCGQCHRSPAGDDPHDSFNRTQLPRFQGLALPKSLCFTNSNGKLSCLTCHDPHDQSKRSQAFYNGKCVSCHQGPPTNTQACSIDPKGDCVTCHMPAQKVGMPVDLRYRNHWIKVWTGSRARVRIPSWPPRSISDSAWRPSGRALGRDSSSPVISPAV